MPGVDVTERPATSTVDRIAVGFADLCGYTARVQILDHVALDDLLSRFEGVVDRAVNQRGGLVVKTLGDAVMFTAPDRATAAAIATELVALTMDDEVLPPAKAGVAFGFVLLRNGDCFGPVVNLASRLAAEAAPGQVLVDASPGGTDVNYLGERPVRDFGDVPVWEVPLSLAEV